MILNIVFRGHALRIALGATMLLLLFAGGASATRLIFTGYETRVTADPGDQYDPAIDGNLIVFTDLRTNDTDVYYVNLNDMTEHPVIVAPGNQELTGVSAGIIVYTDYTYNNSGDIVAFRTANGTTQNITAADKAAAGHPFNSVDPAISLGLVAWTDSRDGNLEIYAKSLTTGEERRVSNSSDIDERPSVSFPIIVWQRCAVGSTCDIWSYDWATQVTTQITNTPASNERNPNVNGRKIVYQGDRSGNSDIYLYDLDTGTEKQLALPGDQTNPHISGDFVAMDDLSSGLYHIKLWHYPSDSVFQITSGASGQYLNDIDGNRVVYTDDRNGDLDIYMYTFTVTEVDTDTTTSLVSSPNPSLLGQPVTFTATVSSETEVPFIPSGDRPVYSGTVTFMDGATSIGTETVSSGQATLTTSSLSVGTHSITAQYSGDSNFNSSTSPALSQQVSYDFTGAGGFQPPIKNTASNTAKAGSVVPVKWQLPDGKGGFISDLSVVAGITYRSTACDFSSSINDIPTDISGNSGLHYDTSTNQFIYNWKTPKIPGCYLLTLRLNDGSEYPANFQLK